MIVQQIVPHLLTFSSGGSVREEMCCMGEFQGGGWELL